MLSTQKILSCKEDRTLSSKINDYRSSFFKIWENFNLDAIISPSFACPANEP